LVDLVGGIASDRNIDEVIMPNNLSRMALYRIEETRLCGSGERVWVKKRNVA